MRHVLVVDDDPSYLLILDRLIRSCGATAVLAATAAEARAALASQKFDLLLLDLQLERQEGLPLIAEVEADPELAPTAVVVTGFPSLAPLFTKLPIVDKGHLNDLVAHLRRILGIPDGEPLTLPPPGFVERALG